MPIPPALAGSSTAAPAAPTVRFETLELGTATGEVARIELMRPVSGEAIATELVRDYRVRMRVTGQRVTREAEGVLVTLDGGRPRRLPDNAELKLSELVPAGESLAPGRHVLLAVAVDAKGNILRAAPGERNAPFSLVDFHVGEKTAELPGPSEPRLFCLAPAGTFHGPEALRVRLELLAIGAAPERTLVRVKGEGVDVEQALDIRKPHAVEGLPMGDVEFTAALPRGASARCIVTLNPGPKGERTP